MPAVIAISGASATVSCPPSIIQREKEQPDATPSASLFEAAPND